MNATNGHVLRDVPVRMERRSLVRSPDTASPAFASVDALRETAHQDGWRTGHDEGRQRGREEGYHAGIEQGIAEGRERGRQDVLQQNEAAHAAIAQRIAQLDQWLSAWPGQLRAALAAQFASSEDDMVALCHLVVCQLLGEHALQPANIASAVRRAIDACCDEGAAAGAPAALVAVHVHPADLAVLRGDPSIAQWIDRQDAAHVRWIADAQVAPAGCIVHGTQGSLDARLDTQLAALREILFAQRDAAASAPTGA